MMQWDPNKRISAGKILQHSYFEASAMTEAEATAQKRQSLPQLPGATTDAAAGSAAAATPMGMARGLGGGAMPKQPPGLGAMLQSNNLAGPLSPGDSPKGSQGWRESTEPSGGDRNRHSFGGGKGSRGDNFSLPPVQSQLPGLPQGRPAPAQQQSE